ncbi:MAG: ribokinase [Planctomycetota bacterium]
MPAKITVVGSANLDFIMRVPRLPAVGETIMGGEFSQAFGGKGANQAVAAARAGGEVALIASLGSDATAETYLAQLQADGINTTHVNRETDVAGGAALIMFDHHGENYLTVAPGANLRVTPERVLAAQDMIQTSDWVVLQQEIPVATNRAVLEIASKHDTPVMLNYAPANDLSLRPDAAVHALIVNETEAGLLGGVNIDPADREACQQLAARLRQDGGHRLVVMTLGKAGVVFADADGFDAVPAFAAEAIDTTAAGDTFCGALAVALGEGQSLADAVRFASAAAAVSVTRIGAQPSIPTREEIETRLKTASR